MGKSSVIAIIGSADDHRKRFSQARRQRTIFVHDRAVKHHARPKLFWIRALQTQNVPDAARALHRAGVNPRQQSVGLIRLGKANKGHQ